MRDDEDALVVGRDHRVATPPNVTADIYLQGGTEHTHGITSTLLSNTAVRAGEIRASLVTRRIAQGPVATPPASEQKVVDRY